MRLSNVRLGRPITSYAAVQAWVASARRNARWQLNSVRVRGKRYLDLGCGPNTHPHFINLDYLWHPGVDLCWDITKGIPLEDRSLSGIFTEHCLEHFEVRQTGNILRECSRILKPGGIIRIIVPDAELYLTRYTDRIRGLSEEPLPFEHEREPVLAVNRIFYQDRDDPAGHRFIYDFRYLSRLLQQSGFSQAGRVSFMIGADKTLLIDTPARAVESLYVEAVRS